MPETVTGGNNLLPASAVLGTDQSSAGVTGKSNTGPGVLGQSIGQGGTGPGGTLVPNLPATDGVLGEGTNGVRGVSATDYGSGTAPAGAGVWGTNTGATIGAGGCGPGVYGESTSGDGVLGNGYHGVHGQSSSTGGAGVWGQDTGSGVGVSGSSDTKYGVYGQTTTGVAVFAKSSGSGLAGQFDGGVTISGTVTMAGTVSLSNAVTSTSTISAKDLVLSGGDCAEQFDVRDANVPEPGTLVVIDDDGTLSQSLKAYDRRVAGVVSGAGKFAPGIVLDRQASQGARATVALVGKVYCKVDAGPAPICVGDLLTTSDMPGVGMKAVDARRAFGAVIGKALAPIARGRGVIPILVALQ